MASFPNKGNKPLSAALLRRRLDGSGWAPVAWDRFGGPPPRITRCYPFKAKRKAIVVVDACSTGASLAGRVTKLHGAFKVTHVPGQARAAAEHAGVLRRLDRRVRALHFS